MQRLAGQTNNAASVTRYIREICFFHLSKSEQEESHKEGRLGADGGREERRSEDGDVRETD